jgi:hypothetical protein
MAYDLTKFTIRDVTECGRAIRIIGEGASSMEDISNKIVRYFYDNLLDSASGGQACSLVRLFKTYTFERFDDNLRSFALNMMPDIQPDAGVKLAILPFETRVFS